MAIKSRNDTQKLLVNMEDKRDYVLSCKDVDEQYIKSIVVLFDDILGIMDDTYNSIINHKGINNNTFNNKLNKLQKVINETISNNSLEEDNG